MLFLDEIGIYSKLQTPHISSTVFSWVNSTLYVPCVRIYSENTGTGSIVHLDLACHVAGKKKTIIYALRIPAWNLCMQFDLGGEFRCVISYHIYIYLNVAIEYTHHGHGSANNRSSLKFPLLSIFRPFAQCLWSARAF